jgi:hypothetical protein
MRPHGWRDASNRNKLSHSNGSTSFLYHTRQFEVPHWVTIIIYVYRHILMCPYCNWPMNGLMFTHLCRSGHVIQWRQSLIILCRLEWGRRRKWDCNIKDMNWWCTFLYGRYTGTLCRRPSNYVYVNVCMETKCYKLKNRGHCLCTVRISRESPCGMGWWLWCGSGGSFLVGGKKGCYWWKTVWRTKELHYYMQTENI